MSSNFFLSVIIPAWNSERFLEGAIQSVLSERYEPMEIIVVDDGSTDGTGELAKKFPIKYFLRKNGGPSAARNTGIRQAKGEVIAFLDADDRWENGRLQCMLPRIESPHQPKIVMGKTRWREHGDFREDPEIMKKYAEPVLFPLLGSALYTRPVFEKVGLFDEALHFGEDIDFFNRVKESGVPIEVIPETVLYYFQHEQNITRQNRDKLKFYSLSALKKSLDRRRASGDISKKLPKISDFNKGN